MIKGILGNICNVFRLRDYRRLYSRMLNVLSYGILQELFNQHELDIINILESNQNNKFQKE